MTPQARRAPSRESWRPSDLTVTPPHPTTKNNNNNTTDNWQSSLTDHAPKDCQDITDCSSLLNLYSVQRKPSHHSFSALYSLSPSAASYFLPLVIFCLVLYCLLLYLSSVLFFYSFAFSTSLILHRHRPITCLKVVFSSHLTKFISFPVCLLCRSNLHEFGKYLFLILVYGPVKNFGKLVFVRWCFIQN